MRKLVLSLLLLLNSLLIFLLRLGFADPNVSVSMTYLFETKKRG